MADRPHPRRLDPLAGDAARGAGRRAGRVPLRRARRASASVVVTAFEIERISKAARRTSRRCRRSSFGIDELLAGGMPAEHAALEVYVARLPGARRSRRGRARRRSRSSSPTICARTASRSTVDRELFEDRRRRKNPTELAGLRRAQRACEAALDVARGMLREAEIADDALVTLRAAHERAPEDQIERVFSAHGVIRRRVHRLARRAGGDRPRAWAPARSSPARRSSSTSSRATARPRVFTDMTRTYVVGDVPDELREYHRLCRRRRSTWPPRRSGPGVDGRDLMRLVCDLFAAHGYRRR